MRPDINFIRQAAHDAGYRPSNVRGNSFSCRCPAHDGKDDPNASFFTRPDGSIGFCCHSRQCHTDRLGWQSMLDALDLTNSDFFPGGLGPSRPRGPDPSLDDWCLVTARDNRARGMRLTEADKRREFAAFQRRRNGIPSPEIAR